MDIDWALIIASVVGDRNAVLRTRAAEKAALVAREHWTTLGKPAVALAPPGVRIVQPLTRRQAAGSL